MKFKLHTIIALVTIVFIGLLFNYKQFNKLPYYIHTWTQADRYALALKFTDNNLNFFQPETFVYNKLYVGKEDPSKTTITAVDFPLHDYLPAVIMKLVDDKSPIIFRLYIFIYSLIGMFFLYKLAFLWTNNFYKSLFVLLLGATSPVFSHYQSGFLPTIPSLANAIIGLFYYSKYVHDQRNKTFNISIIFFTIASLSRTTFLIPLLAVLGIELIRILKKESKFIPKVLPVIISAVLIVGYVFYNKYLRDLHGSMFLANFLPADNLEEVKYILRAARKNWATHYFTNFHYILFILLLLLMVNITICGKVKHWTKNLGIFAFLLLVIFIGNIMFAALLLKQFEVHDYYFLDSFYLPLLCLVILLLAFVPLPESSKSKYFISAAIVLIAVFLLASTNKTLKSRRSVGPWDRMSASIDNFTGSEEFLKSLKIPADAKILIPDASGPNIALMLLNRNGYQTMYFQSYRLKEALTWDFDYIIYENQNLMQVVYPVYPDIIKRLEKIADNGRISVCKYSERDLNQTVEDLLNLENMIPAHTELYTYDSISTSNWKNIFVTEKESYSGSKAGIITEKYDYGITFETNNLPILTTSPRTMIFSGQFLHKGDFEKCFIVASIKEEGENSYYLVQSLDKILKNKNTWEKGTLRFQLPQVKSKNYQFSIYLWNNGRNEFLIDDFEIKFY